MIRQLFALVCIVTLAVRAAEPPTDLSKLGWPRLFEGEGGSLMAYQPQLQSWAGDRFAAQVAFGLTPKEETDPIYGTFTVIGDTYTNLEKRLVTLYNMTIDQVALQVKDKDRIPGLQATVKSVCSGAPPAWTWVRMGWMARWRPRATRRCKRSSPPAPRSWTSNCRTSKTRSPRTTSWRPPRRPRTSRVTTACATGCASPAAAHPTTRPSR